MHVVRPNVFNYFEAITVKIVLKTFSTCTHTHTHKHNGSETDTKTGQYTSIFKNDLGNPTSHYVLKIYTQYA